MLARDYDYEFEQEVQQETRDLHFAKVKPKHQVQADKCVLIRACLFSVVLLSMVTYAFCVWRSTALMESGQNLLSLQTQELQLIESNKTLKLEVEQLKAPERVMGFAEATLGMATARNNIYVYPTHVKQMNSTAYALSHK